MNNMQNSTLIKKSDIITPSSIEGVIAKFRINNKEHLTIIPVYDTNKGSLMYDYMKLQTNEIVSESLELKPKKAETKTKRKSNNEIKSFYKTPSKVGKNSIVKDLSEKYGIKEGDKYVFKTDYIYYGKNTLYNGFNFTIQFIGNENLALVSINNTEDVLGVWKLSEILKSLLAKNKGANITIENVKEYIEKQKLSVRFNKSISKDHGTLWRFK